MAKPKQHLYLIDNLNADRGAMLSKGLKEISSITGVSVDVTQGILEVMATGKPDSHVESACAVAGTALRTKIKKRHLR